MKTVITYGTFDLFHYGHVRLLKRMTEFGERLVVGCSTDEFNALKGKSTVMPYEHRKEVLKACRYVDAVFPEDNWEQKPKDIKEHKADIFIMGDDWSGKFDSLEDIVQVLYLPRTKDISTTEIKKLVKTVESERKDEILHLCNNLLNAIEAL